MKFCSKCGKEIDDAAVICPFCGVPAPQASAPDAPNFGLAVLGFFIPLAGFILWLVMRDATPLKANSAGKGALIGVIVSTVSSILMVLCCLVFYFVIFGFIFSMGMFYY